MVFHMAVGKGNDTTPVMGSVGKIKKAVFRHVNAEIRPANAIWIHIHKGKSAAGHVPRQFRILKKDFISGRETIVPLAGPAEETIESIAADFWIRLAISGYGLPVCRANIYLGR